MALPHTCVFRSLLFLCLSSSYLTGLDWLFMIHYEGHPLLFMVKAKVKANGCNGTLILNIEF